MKLFDATLATAKAIRGLVESEATGGSTTTLIDTALDDPPFYLSADEYNGGTLWIKSGSNADISVKITDFSLSNATFTFATQTHAIAADIKYAVLKKDFPKYILIQSVNQALEEIGPLPATDMTLTTVAHQRAYTLPSGVHNIKRVKISTATSTPYRWKPHYNWEEIEGEIVFDTDHEPSVDSYYIHLTYIAEHTEISADADTITDLLHVDHLAYRASKFAWRWRNDKDESQDEHVINRLNEATILSDKMAKDHPLPTARKEPHYGRW